MKNSPSAIRPSGDCCVNPPCMVVIVFKYRLRASTTAGSYDCAEAKLGSVAKAVAAARKERRSIVSYPLLKRSSPNALTQHIHISNDVPARFRRTVGHFDSVHVKITNVNCFTCNDRLGRKTGADRASIKIGPVSVRQSEFPVYRHCLQG